MGENLTRRACKMSIRQKLFGSLVLVSIIAVLSFAECRAEPVVLKTVTAWQSNYFDSAEFLKAVDAINKRAEGKFLIQYLGGPEVVPVRQLGQALRDGVVDIAFQAMSYSEGLEPAVQYGMYSPFSPWQERENGTLDFWNKIYAKKLNAFCLGRYAWGKQFNILLGKKKVTKPDLTGFKIRSSPVAEPIIKKLGGVRVGTSMEELYAAMDRGVVDGYITPLLGIRDLGLQEVTKSVIDHPFWYTETRAIINLQKWQSLPPDLRKFIQGLFIQEEKPSATRVVNAIDKEKVELKKAGIQFVQFTPADAKTFYNVVWEAAWEYGRKNAPEYENDFRKLFKQ
jgi:TRAP-type C4-dicarboxylate transport system substrate-binding protein